ncbi:MAG: class IV adenylate cyclase [Planctomycetes bacterium]|nr:class IV adenylate cyclase [Planctomycetota bacterium]
MLNIEIKAYYPDLERGARIARSLDAIHVGVDEQSDTYYRVPSGRLKLRTSSLGPNLLVGYHRPDTAEAKESQYTLLEVPDPHRLHRILESVLGVWRQVIKSRTIYLLGNVRVHLDVVQGLGHFLEFEAVITDGRTPEEGHEQVRALMEKFGIASSDLVERSYSDLLLSCRNACPHFCSSKGGKNPSS